MAILKTGKTAYNSYLNSFVPMKEAKYTKLDPPIILTTTVIGVDLTLVYKYTLTHGDNEYIATREGILINDKKSSITEGIEEHDANLDDLKMLALVYETAVANKKLFSIHCMVADKS
ncbi:MAG: hypothetical protein ABIA04_03285 [Pseudomonadota bacterium]